MELVHKFLSAPLSAQLEITNHCNHCCIHCYNLDSDISNRPSSKVSNETVIACAQKLISFGIFAVVITGGEPLVNKSLTKSIIQLFKKSGIKVSLNTNLTLLDDDVISFLSKEGVGILTSCPSANPISYKNLVGVDNYKTFEINIKRVVNAGIPLTINMVITKDNLSDIRITAQKVRELGVNSFAATPMSLNVDYPRMDLLLSTNEVIQVIDDLIWAEKELGLRVDVLEALPKCIFSDKILSEKHAFLNRKCQAGRTTIAVSSNGDVRPCAHNPNSYGNILNDDLKQIWINMNDWRSTKYIPSPCKECAWLHKCNGGCRTNAKTLHGQWNAPDAWTAKPIKRAPAQRQHKAIKFNEKTKFRVNQNIRCRHEYENIMVVYNVTDNDYFMINDVFYNFVLEICSLDTVNFNELKIRYNINNENEKSFCERIYFLVQKGILKITN